MYDVLRLLNGIFRNWSSPSRTFQASDTLFICDYRSDYFLNQLAKRLSITYQKVSKEWLKPRLKHLTFLYYQFRLQHSLDAIFISVIDGRTHTSSTSHNDMHTKRTAFRHVTWAIPHFSATTFGCHFISRVIVTLKIGSFKIAACERCVFAHHFNCERRTHQIIHQFSYWWFFVCVCWMQNSLSRPIHTKNLENDINKLWISTKLRDTMESCVTSCCFYDWAHAYLWPNEEKKIIEKNIAKKRQNNGSSYFWDDDAYDVNSSLHLNKTLFCFLRTCPHNVWSKNNKLKQTNLDMNFKIMMMTN